MAKALSRNKNGSRSGSTKYDAHQKVLSQTYGALADLRRVLSDSKSAVAEREELLNSFSTCADSQRAWLLLEDYFEKLSLARRDFAGEEWWPRLLQARGKQRLEATALLILQYKRPLPTELAPYANVERLYQLEQAAHELEFVQLLENWLLPPRPLHLDSPRAGLRVLCQPLPLADSVLRGLKAEFGVLRPRTGEKIRSLRDLIELSTRSTHEEELFSPADW